MKNRLDKLEEYWYNKKFTEINCLNSFHLNEAIGGYNSVEFLEMNKCMKIIIEEFK